METETHMGKLIIARHHESEWNKLGKWTGNHDSHLTDYGFEKSTEMGVLIKDIRIDYAFASMEVRSIETLSCILNAGGESGTVSQESAAKDGTISEAGRPVPTEHSAALNERDYGDYTGKNKWEMQKELGDEEFEKVRRGWDYPVPNGETLKMVYARVIPYFLNKILPLLKGNKNVLVVAHGNSLRSLTKYIENISDLDIEHIEVPFGSIVIYNLDSEGHMLHKEIRQIESKVNA